MSQIIVRPYEPKDQEATWHVRAMTYNSGRPIPIEQQVYKTSTPYVGEVDGQIVGTFVVLDMTSSRGSQAAWKTGGIAGVAVLPEARYSGVGSAMMRWGLGHLRDNGYILASLYAFRESYYRKFGYEVCGARYKVTCPNARTLKSKPASPIHSVPVDDYSAIRPCYDSFARARSGMALREDLHWNRMLGEGKTLYAAGDPVEAYAVLEHDWRFWEDQPVLEFAWSTLRGYESMLSFFGSVGINKTTVTWHEPSDSPMLARHSDQGVRYEYDKPVMYRILNFAAALEQFRPVGEGKFSVSIEDQDVPGNCGPWEVSYGSGKTVVSPTKTGELHLDARTAVQALLGQPSLDDLLRNGFVGQDVPDARLLLPPSPTYCMEFF